MRKNYFNKLFIFLILFLASFFIHAQSHQVTGTVTDETGESLPGVTILVEGTSRGTITDIDGGYVLKLEPEGAINFSFIGFESQLISVNGRAKLDVVLSEDFVQMDEVVVVGYGTTRKEDLTGSVSVLSSKDMELQPVVRVEAALQSRIAGVQVTQGSGNPGSGIKVRIRGTNSFSGGNGPLYIVDGFFGGDIQSLNPADIESISVLKDASATALYGSQGANGVVIVTTKQGKRDAPASINVKYQKSFSQLAQRWDLMEGWQYMSTVNDKLRGAGTTEENLPFSTRDILFAESEGGTDWQDEVFQLAKQDLVQMTVKKGALVLSAGAQRNEGLIRETKYERVNLRLNYTSQIFDKFKLFMGLSNAFEKRVNSDADNLNIIGAAVTWPSNLTPFDPATGDYFTNQAYGPLLGNPLYLVNERPTDAYRNVLRLNSRLDFNITDYLTFTSLLGGGITGASSTSFNRVSPNAIVNNPLSSSYSNNNSMTIRWQATQQLTYNRTFGLHSFSVSAMYESQSSSTRNFSGNGSDLTTTDLGYYSAPVATFQANGSGRNNTAILSYFGRLNYTLSGKYLFTLNFRHDESSRLAEGFEDANFFGGAFAYRLSEEAFMKNISWLSNLKLRASLGEVGSQAVGFAETLELVSYNKGYSYDGVSFDRGANLPSPKNPELTWERTRQFDIGFDAGFLKDRITFTADYFFKTTTGLHFNQQIPNYLGGGSIKVNSGEMQNQGIELGASGYLVDKGDFSIELSGNVSTVRNKLLSIVGNADFIASGKTTRDEPDLQDLSHRNFINQPIGQLWGFIFDGIYSTDQAEEADIYNKFPGDPIYRDLNGDSVINNDDMTIIGNPNPDFSWGFVSTIKYKRFTLNMVWNGIHGLDVFNSVKYSTYGGAGDATNIDVLDRWTPDNQDSDVPGFTKSTVLRQSSQWIEDGSYIKLRNFALKYDVPLNKIDWMRGLKTLSLTATIQNALVFTEYSGYDPESISGTGDRGGGFDEGGYPIPRIFMVGIDFGF